MQRGLLYVAIAMLTQAIADLGSLFEGNAVSQTKFALQVMLSGAVTWRAYIDSSASQVPEVKDQPVAKSKSTS